jgi:tripartite-type tricarboxylate transporter receptor subunit TctC
MGATLSMLAAPIVAQAQNYPTKPVRVIVAFAAGGFADRNARVIGQKLSDRLGQQFVIDNRGGAGGNVGAKSVADANPDGYTLLVHTAAASIGVSLYKDIGFDLRKDLVPVAITASAPGLFNVHAVHPANTLQELIESTRAKGTTLNYATAGVGTSSHLAAEYLFRTLAGIKVNHIPFKGGAPATIALLGNQVELMSGTVGGTLPHIKQGSLKALAVSSLVRVEVLPHVPTVSESGFPGFEERSWVAFFAPAKTPAVIVNRLNLEINRILAMPDIKEVFASQGADATALLQPEFAVKLKQEIAMWEKIVRATGIKAE